MIRATLRGSSDLASRFKTRANYLESLTGTKATTASSSIVIVLAAVVVVVVAVFVVVVVVVVVVVGGGVVMAVVDVQVLALSC